LTVAGDDPTRQLEADPSALLAQVSTAYRLSRLNLKVDGVPFDLKRYPYLIQPYDEVHPDVVIKKGAQMGWTVWEILIAIDRALHTYDRSLLICFPTRDDVADFSKSRFARLMEQNPSLGKHIKGTDSANIKAVGKVFIYFRGAKSRSQLKSIPCDMVTFDERDEMEESMVELADKRLDGSDFKHRISLSTPSIPDYGVDYEYKHSDRSHWLIKCDGCGKYTCLELEFPSCLKRLEDRVMRVCVHCGHEVHPVHGEWVAMKPAHDRRGYYVSQLNSPTVDPKQILTEWEFLQQEGRDVTEFYNSRLGLAYADVESALDEGLCLSACKSHVRAQSNKGPCAMGVDIGPKELHWWIVSRPDEKSLRTQNYGKVKTFEELQGLEKKFNVKTTVLDAMAETRSVRAYAAEGNGRWGCWYSDTEFKTQVIPQLCNLARVRQPDPRTGDTTYRWVVRGAKRDHYRHALNYAVLAAQRINVEGTLRRRRSIWGDDDVGGGGFMSA
jgi:hypothetical protein